MRKCVAFAVLQGQRMQPIHGSGPGPPAPPAAGLGVGGQLALLPEEQQQSSGVKQRKPYNLQKAREKWTDEEHNKFVEGLRLHGRQWRKIEGAWETQLWLQVAA